MIDPSHLAEVHPDLRGALAALVGRDPSFPGGPDHVVTPGELAALLPELRRRWVLSAPDVNEAVRKVPLRQVQVPGDPPVTAFIVGHAQAGRRRPAILHAHGGGFIVGRAVDYLPVLQAQALALDCVIVSVDYRLAPETPFPGALDDNLAAWRWMRARSADLGIDPARIAIQGESAGGGHAAMLALALRDAGGMQPAALVLTYPMLDDRTGSSRATPGHLGRWCWSAKTNRMGWSALLGCPAGSGSVPPGSVPARATSLSGLPPTFLWIGGLDLFLPETLAFATRLSEAAVPTTLHLVPGVYHGFDGAAPSASVTIGYRMALLGFLAARFGVALHRDTRELLTAPGD